MVVIFYASGVSEYDEKTSDLSNVPLDMKYDNNRTEE